MRIARTIGRRSRRGRVSLVAAAGILTLLASAACGSATLPGAQTPAPSAAGTSSGSAADTPPGSGASTGAGTSSAPGTSAPVDTGNHTLTVWHAYVGQADKVAFMDGALKGFQKAHPEIQLKVVGLEQNAYKTKLQTAMASGNVPDVFYTLPGGYLQTFVKSGKVAALDSDLATDGWGASFVPAALDQVKTDGKAYAVPIDTDAAAIWYNKALFQQNGWAIPKTWDEFTALCKTIKDSGITPIALGNKDAWPATFWFQYGELRTQGAGVIAKFNSGDKSATFGPGAEKSLGMMHDLAAQGYFSDGFNGMTDQDANLLFLNSQAAMVLNGTWQIGSSADAPDGFELGYFPYPTLTGADPAYSSDVVAGVAAAFAISQQSKNKADAVTFLKFLTSKSVMNSYVDIRKTMVNVKGATTEKAAGPLLYDIAQNTVGQAKALDPFYDTAMPPKAMQVYYNTLQGVMDGSVTPAAGAAALEAAMKAGK